MPAVVPFETLPQLYRGLVERYGGTGRAAFSYKDKALKAWTDLSWDDVAERVEAFAAFLHSRGVAPGDRVAILSENRPEWALADLATHRLGAIGVSIYPTLPADQVGFILKDSGAKAVVASVGIQQKKVLAEWPALPDLQTVVALSPPRDERVTAWEEALAQGRASGPAPGVDVAPDDVCALIYTSGTTGVPKGAMLTHRNFASNALGALERISLDENDLHLSFLPLCHAFERTAGYHCMLAAGARIAYAESVDAVAKNLPEVRPTVLVSVPRVFEKVYTAVIKSAEEAGGLKKTLFDWAVSVGSSAALKRAAGGAPGLVLRAELAVARTLVFSKIHEKLGGRVRLAVSGGAALPQAIGEFFEAAGLTIIEGYGLTETAPVLAANPEHAPRFGTVGWVFPGVTVGIRSLESPPSEPLLLAEVEGDAYPQTPNSAAGEILAKGPNVMPGYWQNEAATEEAFTPNGWYRTGDVGQFEDGYLRITDRIKHMIVSKGGKNIYPAPIEEAFATSPLVDQLMVIGEGREFLTALVVPAPDALREALGLPTRTPEPDVLAHPEAAAVYEQLFRTHARNAAPHEKVRAFHLVEPFTVENELLTPTMKLRRRAIEAHHAAAIEALYAG